MKALVLIIAVVTTTLACGPAAQPPPPLPICMDDNMLASTIVNNCPTDSTKALCTFANGTIRFQGCRFNIGTPAAPRFVTCVGECPSPPTDAMMADTGMPQSPTRPDAGDWHEDARCQ